MSNQPEDVGARLRHVKDYIAEQNRKLPGVDADGQPVEKDDDPASNDPSGDEPEPPQRRGPAPDKSQGMGRDTRSDDQKAAIERQTRALYFAAHHCVTFERARRELGQHYDR